MRNGMEHASGNYHEHATPPADLDGLLGETDVAEVMRAAASIRALAAAERSTRVRLGLIAWADALDAWCTQRHRRPPEVLPQ